MGTKRDFRDKVVFVTGAAGGMGRAISRRFSAGGARLGLTDVDEKGLGHLTEEIKAQGGDGFSLRLDVTDAEACRQAIEAVAGHFGRLDVLINNAGITHRSRFSQTDAAVFHRVMAVNYFGSLYCTQAALGHLIRHRGLIVVISSVAGVAPLLGRTGYAASKHALHGLFGSLRSELRRTGVGVTIVCPGFTATNIDKNALDGDGCPTRHPQSKVGRPALPETVAESVFDAAVRDRRMVVLSAVGRLTNVMSKFCPALYERIMAHSLRSELER